MGLKLRETNQRMSKSNSSKLLQRCNTTSSGCGFSSSSIRTTNNNLIVSPGANCNNMQMAIELQQTAGQTNQIIKSNSFQNAGKRCRSLDCSPLEEAACLMNDRKCTQSPTSRPECINCQQHQMVTHQQKQTINSSNFSSVRSKNRTPCTPDCCKEPLNLTNNNNENLLNKNNGQTVNMSIKRCSCKCSACKDKGNDLGKTDQQNCVHQCKQSRHHYNSLHKQNHQPTSQQQSPQHPLQHHSSLQPTGSIHSNLMMPMISHPISALRVNPQSEYIVINKKKVNLFGFKFFDIQIIKLKVNFFGFRLSKCYSLFAFYLPFCGCLYKLIICLKISFLKLIGKF